jgi:hypothetical protein
MPPKHPEPRALIYEIEESPFVEWLNDESYGAWEKQPRRHFLVVTNNDLVDVIARVEPVVTIA